MPALVDELAAALEAAVPALQHVLRPDPLDPVIALS
jgi:hypothetical protein